MPDDKPASGNEPKTIIAPEGKNENKGVGLSQADLDERLTKIRNQERDRNRDKLEAAQLVAKEAKEAQEAMQAEILALRESLGNKVDLPKDPAPDLTDSSVMASQFAAMQEQLQANEELRSKEMEQMRGELVAQQKLLAESDTKAQAMIDKASLMKFKEDLIAKRKVQFPALVSGDTKEEIEESIKVQLAAEEAILKVAKEQWAEENQNKVPAPLSPNSALNSNQTFADRREIAQKSPEEFAKWMAAEKVKLLKRK